MKDRDQQLLWEAYVSEKHHDKKDHDKKDHDEKDHDKKKGKYDDGDGKTERCDFVPCEEDTDTVEETTHSGENSCKDDEYFCHEDKVCKPKHERDNHEVKEEMNNMEFSAIGRENPEQKVFDAVLSWMKADTEGLTTPEDMEGYSMSTAFDDAKEFIRQVLQDISFSEVKDHLNSTVNLGLDDPEKAAFGASVDADMRSDDAPGRELGM